MRHLLATIGVLLAMALPLSAQSGTWSGKLDVQGIQLTMVVHFDEESCTLDSPDQGVKGIKGTRSQTALGGVRIDIPSINAAYEGFVLGEKIVGTFTQHGVSFPLTLTPGEFRRNRPQTPRPPFPYTTEEVSFSNGDAVLKGTLTLPENCDRKTPILLMVTGSGLQNRDEELFEHKPFAVIADALARAGIATLRYDDRGFGESTGDVVSCTTEDLKNDALSGVNLLRERFDHVGVIGHSEGGTIALMLAAGHKVDFAVSMAGMVVSGKETLLAQNRTILPHSGLTEQQTDTYCKALEEVFDCTIQGLRPVSPENLDLPDQWKQNLLAVAMQSSTPYMKHFLQLDLRPELGSINCPVLALNGSKDIQVAPKDNLGALDSAIAAPHYLSMEFEGLNHMFQHCKTGFTEEYKEIEETISPDVLKIIIDWILKL